MIKIISKDKEQEILARMNPNFLILSPYKGMRNDITCECKVCKTVKVVKAKTLVEKNKDGEFRGCLNCIAKERGKSLRKTHEEFIQELKLINPDIEIISEYKTNNDKIRCKCLIDGYEWETKPNALLQGHGCPECSHRKQNWGNKERFDSIVKERFPTITVKNDFTRNKDIMELKCDVCGYEWHTNANTLLNKNYYGCPKCNGFAHVTEDEMIERLKDVNPDVEYVSGYSGIAKRAKFRCLNCNNEWETIVTSVLNGRGCPICKQSHGEKEIKRILDLKGVEYESQYRFSDCRDKRTLPFDFYIKSINTVIEYDGEQHFKPVRFGKTQTVEQIQSKFESCKRRDTIKTNYCADKNINLIRIPYTDFNNIEKILNKLVS